jgi:hypothetical protein
MLLKKEKKVELKKDEPNRRNRRANQASIRKMDSAVEKRNTAVSSMQKTKNLRKKLKAKADENRAKTDKKTQRRIEIGKKEGVNYKRVVLLGDKYVIRESEKETKDRLKKEARKIKQDKYKRKNGTI